MPTDNLNQRWSHGIWVGEAPMTDESVILTENGVQEAESLHRVTREEKFLISELEKAREFLWNDVAENLKSAIETHQDQDPSGHRRMHLSIEIVMRIGATHGCSGRCRIEISPGNTSGEREREFESCRSRSWINCKSNLGAPTANSGDAAGIDTITIFQSYCADARTDTKH